jgi:osmoprotectant transport system permease protein
MSFLDFLLSHHYELLRLTVEHVVLVGVSTLIAVMVGVPLGVWITRRPLLRKAILGLANILQTIPSLALFGFLIPLPFLGGIGARTAIVALVVYALLPIIRNTYTGITSLPPAVIEAGRGMGMTNLQLLFIVEMPLATNVILAGIRTATVVSVGIATIAAVIGAGGLGVYIFRGLSMVNNQMILAGAIPAALLALTADLLLGMLEKFLAFKPEPS